MPHPVALENFLLAEPDEAEEALSTEAPESAEPARTSARPAAIPASASRAEVGPVPNPGAPPEASPAEPEFDPDAERRECLSRIVGTLERIAADQAALRNRWITDAAAAVGTAAASVVPRLARAALARLVAEAADQVARQGRWPRLVLRAAPQDAPEIEDSLRRAGSTAIEVRHDRTLPAGTVQLQWDEGGAEIEIEAIASAALEQLERALAADAAPGGKE